MSITAVFSLADIAETIGGKTLGALAKGTSTKGLPAQDVWYEYCTQRDDRVRPSHAALDRSVWASDDITAPIPPIDYGCRCYLRMVARPGSTAAKVLPAAKRPLTSLVVLYREALLELFDDVPELIRAIKRAKVKDRVTTAIEWLKAKHPEVKNPANVAQMALEVAHG